MKLHLPLSLRSALLAVLAAFSFTSAGETITVNKNEKVSRKLTEYQYSDMTFIVEEGGELYINGLHVDSSYDYYATSFTGENRIVVEGAFTLSVCDVAAVDNEHIASSAEIAVKGNGELIYGGLADDGMGGIPACSAFACIETYQLEQMNLYDIAARKRVITTHADITVEGYGKFLSNSSAYGEIGGIEIWGPLNYNGQYGKIAVEASSYILVKDNGIVELPAFVNSVIAHAATNTVAEYSAKGVIEVEGYGVCYAHYIACTNLLSPIGTAHVDIFVRGHGRFEVDRNIATEEYSGDVVSANIVVEDYGTFNMDANSSMASAYNSEASVEITVKDHGTFNASGCIGEGTASAVTISVEDDSTFSYSERGYLHLGHQLYMDSEITVKDEGTFEILLGGIYGQIIVEDHGQVNMSGGQIHSEITVSGNGAFNCTAGKFASEAEFIIKENGTFKMNGQNLTPDITMQGGRLEEASQYTGDLSIVSDEAFKGQIHLGGVNAQNITRIQTGKGVAISGMAGALELHEGDYMYAGARSAGEIGATTEAMITFEEKGSVFHAENMTLEVDASLLEGLKDKDEFEIWFTNGSIEMEEDTSINFGESWGNFWDSYTQDYVIKDGRLIFGNIWYASKNVLGEDGAITGSKPEEKYNKVVVDKDTNWTVSAATTINYLQGDNVLNIDGKGEITLRYGWQSMNYHGDISSTSGVTLTKAGARSLTISGHLLADGTVKVAEGSLILSGTKNSIGVLELGDEATLEIEENANLDLTETTELTAGSIIGAGDLTILGYVKQIGGVIETQMIVTDNSVFDYMSGTLGNGVEVILESGTIKMNGQSIRPNITMQGGSLEDASKYEGKLSIVSELKNGGQLSLGGINAQQIVQLQIGKGVTLSGLSGELTIHSGDYMYAGAGNIGEVGGTTDSMIMFENGGSILFSDSITLEVDSSLLAELKTKEEFEINLTNGIINLNDTNYITFGDSWGDFWINNSPDITVDGGKLVFASVWYAGKNVSGENGTITGNEPDERYRRVVIDQDTVWTVNGDTVLNCLQGDSDLVVSGKGEVMLKYDKQGAEYQGVISSTEGVTWIKAGKESLTISGRLAVGGMVDVNDGKLVLSGSEQSIGSLGVSGGNLEIGKSTELVLTGTSFVSSGTISGRGKLIINGVMEQRGGSIGGDVSIVLEEKSSLSLSGGTISSGGQVTIKGAMEQSGGSIGGDVSIVLEEKSSLSLSGGTMGAQVTLNDTTVSWDKQPVYDIGGLAAGGSIMMHGGQLKNAEAFKGDVVIDAGGSGYELAMGGLDAGCIRSVSIKGGNRIITELARGSELRFDTAENEIYVSTGNIVDLGNAYCLIKFDADGRVSFGENGAVLMRLDPEILVSGEGFEIWFTNGSFVDVPTDKEELQQWLKKHFTLAAGLDGVEFCTDNLINEGKLVLNGYAHIYYASVHGTEIINDYRTLLYYNKVFVDKTLTLTLNDLSSWGGKKSTVIRQLENKPGEGDLNITANSRINSITVELHNAHTDEAKTNGNTDFYGNITMSSNSKGGTYMATLAKSGNAMLTLHGGLYVDAQVSVREGVLALNGAEHHIDQLEVWSGAVLSVAEGSHLSLTGMENSIDGSIRGKGSIGISGFVQLNNGSYVENELAVTNGHVIMDGSTIVGGVILADNAQFDLYSGSIEGDVTISDHAVVIADNCIIKGEVTVQDDGTLDMKNIRKEMEIVMRGGSLRNANYYQRAENGMGLRIDTDESWTGAIDLGGVQGEMIDNINIRAAGVSIRGINGMLVFRNADNSMVVGSSSINSDYPDFLFDGVDITFEDEGRMNLVIELNSELITQLREEGTLRLYFTNGTFLGMPESELGRYDWLNEHFTFSQVLDSFNFAIESAEDGVLIISGNAQNVYVSSADGDTVDDAFLLGRFRSVVVDKDLTLNIDIAEDSEENSRLRNLDSLDKEADLHINKSGAGDITMELYNSEGSNTTLGGDLTISRTGTGLAELSKTGKGSLTVGGNLVTEDGLSVGEGRLILKGEDSQVGYLNGLGGAESEGELQVDGRLTLSGYSDLEEGKGRISGSGELCLAEGAALVLGDEAALSGVGLSLEKGAELDLNSSQHSSVGALNGSGTLNGGEGGALSITGSSGNFSGTLAGSGSLTIARGAEQTINNIGSMGWDIAVQNGGMLELGAGSMWRGVTNAGTLRLAAAEVAGAGIITSGDVVFCEGSTTEMVFRADLLTNRESAVMITTDQKIIIEAGAHFSLDTLSGMRSLTMGESLNHVLVMSGAEVQSDGGSKLDVETNGLFSLYYDEISLTVEGNAVYLNTSVRTDNPLEDTDADTSETASSGGDLLWEAAKELAAQGKEADETLSAVMGAFGAALTSNPAEASRIASAVAGGAVTALGGAQKDALRERMNRARAHAEQGYYVPQDKKLHTWIEAAASYAKVGADGDESGYKLDSWGGSVGVDYAASESLTVGLSLTAMYGDLTAEAAEAATGKLDAYYFSLWAHKQSSRWGHTFLVTVSTSDASLDRTVDYGTGAYTAQGSTSGSGYGAMYEITYDVPLSETSFWQPLASISMMSTSMDAYRETGAEGAGLAVGEQEQTVTTVAIGARWVSRAGANLFGSTAVVELSGRIAQDMGDTRSEADNALLANPGYTRKVQGAEVGSTALQLGAGLAIPTGKTTQVYMNANADLRSGSTSWNVGAGLRCSF